MYKINNLFSISPASDARAFDTAGNTQAGCLGSIPKGCMSNGSVGTFVFMVTFSTLVGTHTRLHISCETQLLFIVLVRLID
jgi:hypothetical protein